MSDQSEMVTATHEGVEGEATFSRRSFESVWKDQGWVEKTDKPGTKSRKKEEDQ